MRQANAVGPTSIEGSLFSSLRLCLSCNIFIEQFLLVKSFDNILSDVSVNVYDVIRSKYSKLFLQFLIFVQCLGFTINAS